PSREEGNGDKPGIQPSGRRHCAAQPPRFARWCTPRRSATSRNRARLAAKKRPSNRHAASFCNRACQFSALLPSRSKIPASSPEITALPSRNNRPVYSTRSRQLPSENPSIIPSRAESSRRRSSTGQSHSPSSRPAAAVEPATLPAWAAFRSSVRPCSLTCSTGCLIEVCALDSGTSAIPAATGVQIDVSTGRQQRLLIEDRHALEPALEERAAGLLLAVGQPRERLLQALHGPAQALQPLA